jgi:endogenous inhibitor of DNA gyrase (YacG/DUF329 family)
MKMIKLKCPNCGQEIFYKNYLYWVLDCPFHWFGKRLTKCLLCGKKSYMKRVK